MGEGGIKQSVILHYDSPREPTYMDIDIDKWILNRDIQKYIVFW